MIKVFVAILIVVGILLNHAVSAQTEISVTSGIGLTRIGGAEFVNNTHIGSQIGRQVSLGLKSKFSITFSAGLEYHHIDSMTRRKETDPHPKGYFVEGDPEGGGEYSHIQLTYSLEKFQLEFPLMIRLNYKPAYLIEDFMFFVGAGASINILNKALAREYVFVQRIDPVSSLSTLSDFNFVYSVTENSKKVTTMIDMEYGFTIKRLTLLIRRQVGLSDLTPVGVEKTSPMLQQYSDALVDSDGWPYEKNPYYSVKIKEAYWELVFRFRINKLKKF
jgi:hypothetical protein